MKRILSYSTSLTVFLTLFFSAISMANGVEDKLLVRTVENSEAAVSHWVFADNSLAMVDSYSPFIFRTKKSQSIEEVRIQLEVDSMGRISGFDVLNSDDKGLIQRLDYVIRKLPKCEPVPGHNQYGSQVFEMVIRK